MTEERKLLKQAAEILGVHPEEVPRTVRKLLEETRELEQKASKLR